MRHEWAGPRRGLVAAALPWMLASATVTSPADAVLRPEAVAGWERYVDAAEMQMAAQRGEIGAFLGQDYMDDARQRRERLRAGDIVVDELSAVGPGGETPDVAAALVHHWRGAVFIPGLSAHEVIDAVERRLPGRHQEDVLEARVLAREPGHQRVFLQLQRSKFVTAIFNTEHDVRFYRPAPDRAWSASTAVRIAEVRNLGTAREVELPPGRDRGFLWRWNAYWRYQDVPGGTIVECESISLSRGVPAVVRFIAAPLIRQTASESMTRTLETLRARFTSS